MPGATTRLALPYPVAADVPAGHTQIQALADKLDPAAASAATPQTVVAFSGTLAARPAASKANRLYYATDEQVVYLDTGSAWVSLPTLGSGRLPDTLDMKFSGRRNEHSGWIKADGRALAAGVYPAARAALVADGNPFGVSGSNPLIPNMMGRVPMGAGSGAGLTARTFGGSGGAETHVLLPGETAIRNHEHDMETLNQGGAPPSTVDAGGGKVGVLGATQVNGSSRALPAPLTNGSFLYALGVAGVDGGEVNGGAHNNVQPFTIGQWFVYAGSAT